MVQSVDSNLDKKAIKTAWWLQPKVPNELIHESLVSESPIYPFKICTPENIEPLDLGPSPQT